MTVTVEELSNRILDEGTDLEENVNASSADSSFDDNASDAFEHNDCIPTDDETDSLTHYGVKGMKWGIRKDKEYKPKKKDRRYDGESDQDYQNRMAREERERSSKQSEKSKVKSEKRAAKERAQTQKRMLKSQERIKQMEIKAQQKNKKLEIAERKRQEKRSEKVEAERKKEQKRAAKEQTKSRPVNTRTLSDQELNDAIQRLRNEQTYKQLSLQNRSLQTKTIVKAATISGGILLAVGTAVAKKQLTDVGNQKVSAYLEKKGWLKKETSDKQKKKKDEIPDMDDFRDIINEILKEKGI